MMYIRFRMSIRSFSSFDFTSYFSHDEVLGYVRSKLTAFPPILERKFLSHVSPAAAASSNDPRRIRVMQWNTLARGLWSLDEKDDDYSSDSQMPKEVYDWENFRFWRTLEEILRFQADIICLEEVDQYEQIKPYLHSIGYTSIYCPKFQSPCFGMRKNYGPDGSAIFYRLSLFQIENMSCEKIVLEGNDVNSQVFIILRLKHLPSGQTISVVCVHLKSKSDHHQKRAAQIKFVLDKVKQHLLYSDYQQMDVQRLLLCGDFNGEPFEDFYKTIVNDQDFKSQLVDAYTVANNGHKETTTTKIRDGVFINRAIDYIFFNKNKLQLLSYLELPKSNQAINTIGLPNLEYSSDHLSLVCDFKII